MTNKYMDTYFVLRDYANDKRRADCMRDFFAEVAQCLKDCDEERRKYKYELETLKNNIENILNILKED